MAKLLVQESNGAREFELVDLEVAIGRELDNTLRLSDPSISRHHAVIRQTELGFEIQDLQSSNGILLNGARVPSARLHDGDRITLGQMQLTFVDSGPAANPLGTVRMSRDDMARFRASMVPEGEALPVRTPGAPERPLGATPFAAEPSAALPAPAGAPFLGRFLPPVPDTGIPLRTPDDGVVRGDFQTRLLAGLIDGSPMVLFGLLSWGFGQAFPGGAGAMADLALALLQVALLVGYLVLMPVCWMQFGATPGKTALGLRVVPEDDPAGHLDLSAAIARLFGYLVMAVISWVLVAVFRSALPAVSGRGPGGLVLPAVVLVACIVPYLMILGPERKGLEDRFSRSIVIKVE